VQDYQPEEAYDIALPLLYQQKPPLFAFELVRIGAQAGDPLAQFSLATQYLYGNKLLRVQRDEKLGIVWLRRSAKSFARAKYYLAIAYAEGLSGVAINQRRSFELHCSAANDGHLGAMFETARRLHFGHGVLTNKKRATLMLRKARKLDDAIRTQQNPKTSKRAKKSP
jgi:TPR repeat protein